MSKMGMAIVAAVLAIAAPAAGRQGLGRQGMPSAANIQFETVTIDYGTIQQGADGIRTFKFRNIGSEPLVITAAQGSCGCLVPQAPIMPGSTSMVNVKYDTQRLGAFNKTVTIQSNAKSGNVVLTVKGIVVTPARN